MNSVIEKLHKKQKQSKMNHKTINKEAKKKAKNSQLYISPLHYAYLYTHTLYVLYTYLYTHMYIFFSSISYTLFQDVVIKAIKVWLI